MNGRLAAVIERSSWSDIARVVSLADYNTRLVVVTTAILGLACGMVGSYLLLRKRSLMGDAISHATLPGIAMAYLIMHALGRDAKALAPLLIGAAVAGTAGGLLVLVVRSATRIKDDAAMGIVLSVFFGAGVALLAMINTIPSGSAAGLESFIYGKTASIVFADFQLLAGVSVVAVAVCLFLFKELRLLCFDEAYARSIGRPARFLDMLLMALVTAVTVAGLQAVGLILVIAFLITPAAAARFWTERTAPMLAIAGVIGTVSGWLGASVSAFLPRIPAGAMIVLVAAAIFLLSMLFGTSRGVIQTVRRRLDLQRRVRQHHLLRSAFELLETNESPEAPRRVAFEALLAERSWSRRELERLVREAWREDLVDSPEPRPAVTLTQAGLDRARQVTRNHRLWEMYLIKYAEVAPNHVDREADIIEHVLGEDLVRELERALIAQELNLSRAAAMPASPHPLGGER